MRAHAVTFVAMGNGAPDLSANISAIRSGQVALSAGAFTGAAMFVQCVVASEVCICVCACMPGGERGAKAVCPVRKGLRLQGSEMC